VPEALLISNVLLWIAVVAMALIIVALVRQIGILHERVAPAGALMMSAGPKVGERPRLLEVADLAGTQHRIGADETASHSRLIFFLSPTCPVCKTLLPTLRSIAKSEASWLRVLLASDGTRSEHEAFVADHALGDFPYLLSRDLGLAFQVGKLPHAVLLDESGVVRAQGLVNTREHLESLFEAKELGFASVQDFLEAEGAAAGVRSLDAADRHSLDVVDSD
jgi:methylamine dehydrogenase accessory protein MauD